MQQQRNVDRDVSQNANAAQLHVMEKFGNCAGDLYNLLEIAFPVEAQYSAVKKRLNDILYGTRNELLFYFKDYSTE
jgi:hypothetical protein